MAAGRRSQEPRRWLLIAAVCLVGCMTEPEDCADCEAEMAAVREARGMPELVEHGERCEHWWYGKHTCGGVKVRISFDWAADSCRVSTLSWFGGN